MSEILEFLQQTESESAEEKLYRYAVADAKKVTYEYFTKVRRLQPYVAQSKCKSDFTALAFANAIKANDLAQIDVLLKAQKKRGK